MNGGTACDGCSCRFVNSAVVTDSHSCPRVELFAVSLFCVFRVATCQGKVREKQNFLQVRELSGNFEKMSGNFGHLTNVREMSGNFVMTVIFF